MAVRNRGITFLICFRKRRVPRKKGWGGGWGWGWGFPQKKGVSKPARNYGEYTTNI